MDTSTRVEIDLRKSGTEALREQEWIWEEKKRLEKSTGGGETLEDNTDEALKCDSNDLSGLLAEGRKKIPMVANFPFICNQTISYERLLEMGREHVCDIVREGE